MHVLEVGIGHTHTRTHVCQLPAYSVHMRLCYLCCMVLINKKQAYMQTRMPNVNLQDQNCWQAKLTKYDSIQPSALFLTCWHKTHISFISASDAWIRSHRLVSMASRHRCSRNHESWTEVHIGQPSYIVADWGPISCSKVGNSLEKLTLACRTYKAAHCQDACQHIHSNY